MPCACGPRCTPRWYADSRPRTDSGVRRSAPRVRLSTPPGTSCAIGTRCGRPVSVVPPSARRRVAAASLSAAVASRRSAAERRRYLGRSRRRASGSGIRSDRCGHGRAARSTADAERAGRRLPAPAAGRLGPPATGSSSRSGAPPARSVGTRPTPARGRSAAPSSRRRTRGSAVRHRLGAAWPAPPRSTPRSLGGHAPTVMSSDGGQPAPGCRRACRRPHPVRPTGGRAGGRRPAAAAAGGAQPRRRPELARSVRPGASLTRGRPPQAAGRRCGSGSASSAATGGWRVGRSRPRRSGRPPAGGVADRRSPAPCGRRRRRRRPLASDHRRRPSARSPQAAGPPCGCRRRGCGGRTVRRRRRRRTAPRRRPRGGRLAGWSRPDADRGRALPAVPAGGGGRRRTGRGWSSGRRTAPAPSLADGGPLSSASGGPNAAASRRPRRHAWPRRLGSRSAPGPRPASARGTSTPVGSVTSAMVPRSWAGRSSTLTPCRAASRATTTRPIIRETATSTMGGVASRSLRSASWSGDMPMPRSSTCSTARSPTRRASTDDGESGGEKAVALSNSSATRWTRSLTAWAAISMSRSIIAELDPGVVLDLGLGGAQHVDEGGRLALHAGRVGAGEHQQVLVVAAHPGGQVVELEQLGQPVRVLLAALQPVEVADQPVDQDLGTAGQVDEHRRDGGPQRGLLGGGPDGLQVDRVERLGHLAELVPAADRQRFGDLLGDLGRRRVRRTAPGRAAGPPPAAGRTGRRPARPGAARAASGPSSGPPARRRARRAAACPAAGRSRRGPGAAPGAPRSAAAAWACSLSSVSTLRQQLGAADHRGVPGGRARTTVVGSASTGSGVAAAPSNWSRARAGRGRPTVACRSSCPGAAASATLSKRVQGQLLTAAASSTYSRLAARCRSVRGQRLAGRPTRSWARNSLHGRPPRRRASGRSASGRR